VRDLALKEGDMIEADLLALRKTPQTMTREEAIAGLMATNWPLPKGYKFDREEANAR
jgi:hypothetical protein